MTHSDVIKLQKLPHIIVDSGDANFRNDRDHNFFSLFANKIYSYGFQTDVETTLGIFVERMIDTKRKLGHLTCQLHTRRAIVCKVIIKLLFNMVVP